MKILFKPKRFFLTKKIAVSIVVILVLLTVVFIVNDYKKSVNELSKLEIKTTEDVKSVKIIKLNSNGYNFLPSQSDSLILQASGSVKPITSVDVIALTNGTVRFVDFKVGDQVNVGKLLARLQNNTLSINYSNAQLGLSNTLNNNQAMSRLSEDGIRRAEIGVENSLKSVQSAKIALKTAENNLSNSVNLQNQNSVNKKKAAMIPFFEYLNVANTALKQTNYIIRAEGPDQYPGIARYLAACDFQSLVTAKYNYQDTKRTYDSLSSVAITEDNIKTELVKMIDLLNQTKGLIYSVIIVLDNTVSGVDFSNADLISQKASFNLLHGKLISLQTQAEKTLYDLNTSTTINQAELDNLNNAIKTAKNQLKIAEISSQNAVLALERAKQSNQQQSIANKSAIDNARGQLNIIGTQTADLSITAPVSGKVITKYIEIGQELQPGMKIAQIANIDIAKIEISLLSEDIYKINLGQSVLINNELQGFVSLISPVADPVTKKVKVEISYDNKDQNLILGTFVDVSIPVSDLNFKIKSNIILVPLKAVTITQNESFVFIMKDGEAVKTEIEIGQINGTMIEVNGLNHGDNLIVEGNKELEQGSKVKIEQ